jgi:hypothetical protein
MVVVVIVTILLNAAGLELATRRDMDLDRELRASGIASLASGLAGGMVGYLSVSRSVLNVQAGALPRPGGPPSCAGVAFGLSPVPTPAPSWPACSCSGWRCSASGYGRLLQAPCAMRSSWASSC